MPARSVGVSEKIDPDARLRSKLISMLDYKSLEKVVLAFVEDSRNGTRINNVEFYHKDYSVIIHCNVMIPNQLYDLFDADLFNKLKEEYRFQAFKNLCDFIKKG